MEIARSLRRGDLPPVGNPIVGNVDSSSSLHQLPNFEKYSATWVDSGTSALALALISAKKLSPEIAQPEVIVPAYCGPEVVAAAQFSGVKVIVVDISMNDPALNLHTLKPALSGNTIAIIAVNFLGVREELDKLIALKFKFPRLCIIEDNSQWFPDESEIASLSGDFVVFSFGRDMPVGLLSGGLLLSKYPVPPKTLSAPRLGALFELKRKLKYSTHNLLLKPKAFQLINRIPFSAQHSTIYRPLEKICAMDGLTRSLVLCNLREYWKGSQALAKKYDEFFAQCKIHNKFGPIASSRRKRLLRYPMLFGSLKKKEQIVAQLRVAGLGVTEFYKTALSDIEGVRGKVTIVGEQKNAIFFAHHFVTLPLHSGVTEQHFELIKQIFSLERHG